MKRTIDQIITEIKSYEDLQEQIKSEVESLRIEAIQYLQSNNVDEYCSDAGKITFREVISNRFASTEFKKLMPDLYQSFIRKTSSMRFTCC